MINALFQKTAKHLLEPKQKMFTSKTLCKPICHLSIKKPCALPKLHNAITSFYILPTPLFEGPIGMFQETSRKNFKIVPHSFICIAAQIKLFFRHCTGTRCCTGLSSDNWFCFPAMVTTFPSVLPSCSFMNSFT